MKAAEILREARHTGIHFRIDGDALILDASVPPPPALLDLLVRHKAQIIQLVARGDDGWSGEDWQALFDERAAIAEHDGGFQRLDAELLAFEECVDRWLLSHPPHPGPAGSCVSCGQLIDERDPGAVAIVSVVVAPTVAKLHPSCASTWYTNRRWHARRIVNKLIGFH